ncbi:MAG: DUF151 domain-containing protein [Chloroflexi bacterium]|nr:DUF151 domain-containing protein [Chloroflexota bacterium]
MPPHSLPARPSLEQLKNQAKDLLKAYRAGQPTAVARLRESMPRRFGAVNDQPDPPSVSLRDAQHVVAAEYGFASWSQMHSHILERESIPMIEMTVEGIKLSHRNQQRVVVLKGKGVNVYLPIWIGPAEGDSIAMKLQGRETVRPMTHDLMDSMIGDLGGTVKRVIVSELKAETFFGKIVLQRNGTTIERDSRPSDAIALAVRTGASIYAEEDVLDRAGVEFDPETGEAISTKWQWISRTLKEIKEFDYAFSEEARKLFEEAGHRAYLLGHEEITQEHLLLALLNEAEGAGARVLSDLGLDLAAARAELEGRAEREYRESDRGLIDFSEASRSVLSLSRTEAYMIFEGQVGTEHILLGLILADEGLASHILKDGGIEIEAARAAVRKMTESEA